MTSIDRIAAQGASRTYVQNTDAAQTAVQLAGKANARHQSQQAQGADSVTLSDNARSLAAARAAVQNVPDVRQQKVADIKQQVADGTYQVSAKVLARKMLDTQA